MRLAIIDDGINRNIFPKDFMSLTVDNGVVKKKSLNNESDLLSHATIVAGIIDEKIKDTCCEYVSIDMISNKILKGNLSDLIVALRWCLDNNIDIINLSIGSTQIYDKYILIDIVYKLLQKGIIIIASMSNDYVLTYPASLNGVIGVKYNFLLSNNEIFVEENPIDGIEISAGCKMRVYGSNISPCNSFATALVTGEIIRSLSNETVNNNVTDIITCLRKKNKGDFCIPYYYFNYENTTCNTPCVRVDIFDNCKKTNAMENINQHFKSKGYHSIFITKDILDINRDIYAIRYKLRRVITENKKMTDICSVLFFDSIANPDIILLDNIAEVDKNLDFQIIKKNNTITIQGKNFENKYKLPLLNPYEFIVDKIIETFENKK